jgi:hypothetical protein
MGGRGAGGVGRGSPQDGADCVRLLAYGRSVSRKTAGTALLFNRLPGVRGTPAASFRMLGDACAVHHVNQAAAPWQFARSVLTTPTYLKHRRRPRAEGRVERLARRRGAAVAAVMRRRHGRAVAAAGTPTTAPSATLQPGGPHWWSALFSAEEGCCEWVDRGRDV